ncbi:hypothetical protein C8J57DRAFT_1712744 [Mycena rebaudengoi]|nr:hypothetical protein C8J57DRAFT_1712744 [Mycena rebaudengoi]
MIRCLRLFQVFCFRNSQIQPDSLRAMAQSRTHAQQLILHQEISAAFGVPDSDGLFCSAALLLLVFFRVHVPPLPRHASLQCPPLLPLHPLTPRRRRRPPQISRHSVIDGGGLNTVHRLRAPPLPGPLRALTSQPLVMHVLLDILSARALNAPARGYDATAQIPSPTSSYRRRMSTRRSRHHRAHNELDSRNEWDSPHYCGVVG